MEENLCILESGWKWPKWNKWEKYPLKADPPWLFRTLSSSACSIFSSNLRGDLIDQNLTYLQKWILLNELSDEIPQNPTRFPTNVLPSASDFFFNFGFFFLFPTFFVFYFFPLVLSFYPFEYFLEILRVKAFVLIVNNIRQILGKKGIYLQRFYATLL